MQKAKPYRSIVSEYNGEERKLYKILTLLPPKSKKDPEIKWEWVPPETIEDDPELTSNYLTTIEYQDIATQTETPITLKQEELDNLNVSIPVNSYTSFLPNFDGIVDSSTLKPPTSPSIIHEINLEEKTARVSYNTSTKTMDLSLLMSIDPYGVAKFLTSK